MKDEEKVKRAHDHAIRLANKYNVPGDNVSLNFLTYKGDFGAMCLQRLGVPDNYPFPLEFLVCNPAYTSGRCMGTPISAFPQEK